MCMKKLIKKPGRTTGRKMNLTIDERLDKLNAEVLAPKKLAEANRHLKKMKSLPKQTYPNHREVGKSKTPPSLPEAYL